MSECRWISPARRALAGIAALLLGACASAPALPPLRVTASTMAASQAPRAAANLRVFDAVWNEINRKYYDPAFNGVDWDAAAREFSPQAEAAVDDTVLYGVLNGMLAKLEDGHVGAISPARVRDFSRQQVTGIGIRAQRIEERTVVLDVYPGGSADVAGVKPGWIVVSRNGRPFPDKIETPPAAPGDIIHMAFLDTADRPVELALAASAVKVITRQARLLADGTAYLRFDEFDFESIDWLHERLTEFRNAPRLILDLRENPGGNLLVVLSALGDFIDNAEPAFVSLGRDGRRNRSLPLMRGSPNYRGAIAILTSAGSASCSEVLAGVLQERGRAIVVGQPTSGSVLPAVRETLPGGGILQLSVTELITMHGHRLEGTGVTPDIAVPARTLADIRGGRDPSLERAREAFNGK